jgi:RNA polymerase sigma-70 factor (ECF subfamily)
MSKKSELQELGINFFNNRSELDFNKLYRRMKPSINYYLRDILPSMDDREEALANTFAKVWTKIHMYDPYWNFSTWVYRIARNEALLMLRHKRRNYSYEGMEERGINMESKSPTVEIESELEGYGLNSIDALYEQAISEISRLPEIYRIVMEMREIEKKKYEDISEELGWKHNTVRTRIRKGRELLKNNLTKKYPELVLSYEHQTMEN